MLTLWRGNVRDIRSSCKTCIILDGPMQKNVILPLAEVPLTSLLSDRRRSLVYNYSVLPDDLWSNQDPFELNFQLPPVRLVVCMNVWSG